MNADEKAIAGVLASYQEALNQSSTDMVMKLYAPDGVFMPQHFASSVGSDAIRKAYDGVFKAIKLEVKFDIAEVHQVAPNWAFARTNSAGKVRINATGQSSPEANQELFVFQKIGENWKISRYCFSTTNPPH
ncbi:MAG TPA: SgcJ/EcaC family oxidoreductase [Phycisphaerae bacterium]|nr:SgcJ/EcaC family oxidoreductase [Phycisphaerae bacterium]